MTKYKLKVGMLVRFSLKGLPKEHSYNVDYILKDKGMQENVIYKIIDIKECKINCGYHLECPGFVTLNSRGSGRCFGYGGGGKHQWFVLEYVGVGNDDWMSLDEILGIEDIPLRKK